MLKGSCDRIAYELASMPFSGNAVDPVDQIFVDLNVHSNV